MSIRITAALAVAFAAGAAVADECVPMPAQTSTFSPNTRGY